MPPCFVADDSTEEDLAYVMAAVYLAQPAPPSEVRGAVGRTFALVRGVQNASATNNV